MSIRVCEICGAQRAFFGIRHFQGAECKTAQKKLGIDIKDTPQYESLFSTHKLAQDWDGKVATIESLKSRGVTGTSGHPGPDPKTIVEKTEIATQAEVIQSGQIGTAFAATVVDKLSETKPEERTTSREEDIKKVVIQIPTVPTLGEMEKTQIVTKALDVVQPEIPTQNFTRVAEATVSVAVKSEAPEIPVKKEVAKNVATVQSFSISPSKSSVWKSCHRLYKYQYIDKLAQPPQPALLKGQFVHKVLENFHRAIKNQGEPSSRATLLGTCFKNVRSMQPYISQLSPDDLVETKKILQDYLQQTHMIIVKTIFLEERFKFGWKNLLLNGVVDRVDELAVNAFEIIDYKTDTVMPTVEEVQESDQLVLYDWWLRSIKGKDADIVISFWYLKHGKKVTLRSSPELLQKLTRKYEKSVQEIQESERRMGNEDPNVIFEKNLEYRWHSNCPYLELCNKS
jgi:RecB family exonuclease